MSKVWNYSKTLYLAPFLVPTKTELLCWIEVFDKKDRIIKKFIVDSDYFINDSSNKILNWIDNNTFTVSGNEKLTFVVETNNKLFVSYKFDDFDISILEFNESFDDAYDSLKKYFIKNNIEWEENKEEDKCLMYADTGAHYIQMFEFDKLFPNGMKFYNEFERDSNCSSDDAEYWGDDLNDECSDEYGTNSDDSSNR